MKIVPMGAELFNMDGKRIQTDLTKLRVTVRNFTKAPKYVCRFDILVVI
jgi:hypothetical protein